MRAPRTANLGLRFLLELGMLVGVGWWGRHELGWWAAVLLPLVFATIWGTFLSPKARVELPRPALHWSDEAAGSEGYSAPGGGKGGSMEPKHRESEDEERAAERAADATEESRARRGDEDVRIEDDEAAPFRPPLDDPDTAL